MCQNFPRLFSKKEQEDEIKISKINGIICSIYICYYLRLINDDERKEFKKELRDLLLKLVNTYSDEQNEKMMKMMTS